VISTDEIFIFDTIESLARRGNYERNLTNDLQPAASFTDEPLAKFAVLPLFYIVERLPGVGMVQGVWLFNNLVTSATAGLLFYFALALGYRLRSALALGAIFAFGTIAWPYSKAFFREPLAAFLLLLSAYALVRWRRSLERGRVSWGWLGAAVLSLVAVQLVKNGVAFFAAPTLLILAAPKLDTARVRFHRRHLIAIGIIAGLAAVALIGIAGQRIEQRLSSANYQWVADAVGGYLFSPGKSLFVYSPVLLLGLAGTITLARRRQWREALAPATMLAVFVLGYAVWQNENWFGGTGWGPRYMVPLTGLLLLPALPLLERALTRDASRRLQTAVVGLVVLGVGVQLVGTMIPVPTYYTRIRGGTAWDVGVWRLDQTHIWINLKLLADPGQWGVPWHWIDGGAAVPLLCVLLVGLAAFVVIRWGRRFSARKLAGAAGVAALLIGALFLYALQCYGKSEALYLAKDERLRQMLDYLDQAAGPDDVVVLNNPEYRYFFYNFNKMQRLYIFLMPSSPGEQPSPEQAAEVISDNPDELLEFWTPRIIHQLADNHDALWLVVDASEYEYWRVRPVERWMARHYFPVFSHDAISAQVRVVRYSTVDAPPAQAPPWPEHTSGASLGQLFALVGYDVVGGRRAPDGHRFRAGEPVNISLLWRADAAAEVDYNVGLFLLGPDGLPIAERHSAPVGGFANTSQWEPGQYWRDNHALLIPGDAPPGTYALRLIVYDWQDNTRLPVTGAAGDDLGDFIDLGAVVVE
jgi:hypothetical protein